MTTTSTTSDTTIWTAYWADINGERWLTAKALIELSPSLHREATSWVDAGHDLRDWIRDVDDSGRGWSSTEARLFHVVAALVDPYPNDEDARGRTIPLQPYTVETGRGRRRLIPLADCLDSMGSWEAEVWQVLVNWGTGGNNREHGGRARVVTR